MANENERVKREYFMHFLNCTPGDGTATYARLGSGNDSLSRVKNMVINKTRDVTGASEITVNNGDEQLDVTPYYARRGTPLFEFIMSLDDNDAELDETLTDYVEVKAWEEGGVVLHTATRRECYVEIVEVGGDPTGFQIPFNLHFSGKKEKGTWNPSTKMFTPDEE